MKTTPKLDAPKPVIVLPTDTDKPTIAAAKAAGYLPILCDDPAKVKVVLAGNDIIGGDMLMSALHGLCSTGTYGSDQRSAFVQELNRRLKAKE